MQQATEQLLPATGYCIETRAIALSNGYFPGFLLERTFIGKHVVDGLTFLEFQNATGARHVIDASTIERIIPLGRMARLGDALRTAKVQA
ncbi:hypothetical protein [Paraburkholderia diazotrophica]|uniref:Uncharacterized protein n=1 Tax=Paraburkholderia diazotrophica TaxID=667676 RepID=A0A1H7EI73_9BURK|nr:hypothetical protein [Paraburkholderia diazotrophica]SEK10345.1 hypothetical protein SAMN05192539_104755 [Paraburkholderia diazotrophica]